MHPCLRETKFREAGWDFVSSQGPIADAETLRIIEARQSAAAPEMLFSSNRLAFYSSAHECSVEFTAEEAFSLCLDASIGALPELGLSDAKVAETTHWKHATEGDRAKTGAQEIRRGKHWTFTTLYRGNVTGLHAPVWTPSERGINYEVLKRPDPILWFSQLLLFESELDDHGRTSCEVKCRVMPSCWFVLLRCVVRIDGVLLRVLDTRLFHEFGSTLITREVCHREEALKTKLSDARDISEHVPRMPITFESCEEISLV